MEILFLHHHLPGRDILFSKQKMALWKVNTIYPSCILHCCRVDLLSIVVPFVYRVAEQQNTPVLLSTGQQEDKVTV
jgi:hypothetical protein